MWVEEQILTRGNQSTVSFSYIINHIMNITQFTDTWNFFVFVMPFDLRHSPDFRLVIGLIKEKWKPSFNINENSCSFWGQTWMLRLSHVLTENTLNSCKLKYVPFKDKNISTALFIVMPFFKAWLILPSARTQSKVFSNIFHVIVVCLKW